jgi:hypothetical protein
MGKSIIHCADCGKAVREDDFARGKASTIDSRTYCSDCRPVSPPSARKLDLQKSSTSKIPVRPQTARRVVPATDPRSPRWALWGGGGLVASGLLALLAFAFFGKGGKAPVEEPVANATRPPEPVLKKDRATPEAKSPEPPSIPERKPESEARPDTAPRPAEPEKIAAPRVKLSVPPDGARFPAATEVVLEAELQDPGGKVARVEFWQGGTKLGEAKETPYRISWKGIPGKYELRAKSIDASGVEIESAVVRISVEHPEAEEVAKTPPEPGPPKPAPLEPAKDQPASAEGKAPAPSKKESPPPKVDPKKVDAAVKKGVLYLVSQVGALSPAAAKDPVKECRTEEFVLWTFVHAGVSETSPVFRHLFKSVTEAEPKRTYEAALQAMILEELDRVRYQGRILQCAQFLADNQCPNGQWPYGESVPPSKDVPTTAIPLPTPSRSSGSSSTGERQKPLVVQRLKVAPRKNGPAEGDNSNSQYAALGIRSCVDAGVDFPEDTYRRARKWMKGSQHSAAGGAGIGVATGGEPSAPPAGWCYMGKNHDGHNAYGSMTVGAIGALAIYDTLLGEDWRKDPAVASGISWMAKNFSVAGNPGPPSERWCKDTHYGHFYFLYGLERAGVLCRTEWMGRHPWYSEGAGFLLANQDRDGSWSGNIYDTCFAILFLKRATHPLEDVASLDDKGRK